MTKYEILKSYFGHEEFRPGQEQVIDSILQGRDVLCVMPTGAGKSVCYQVPALMQSGITLVVSPLISLMKDQVNALTQSGIRAAYINSSLTQNQYRKVLDLVAGGVYKIIYVAPERLVVNHFPDVFSQVPVSMVAVDEAHCVSQWGQDFRPSYLKIVEFIDKLPYRPVVGAFTATATQKVKADIANILRLREPFTITTGFDRPNLYFGVIAPENKPNQLLELLSERRDKSGIIYCATRKAVEEVCDLLNQHGFEATRYHAGLSDRERRQNQDDFVFDRTSVMVATNAFGMGIDKSNVSFVIHYNMPKNVESYYQEAGRAGRDGSPADCILLYSAKDVFTNQFLIDHSESNPELDREAQEQIRAKDRERLKYMTFYCTTAECLRAFILNYFGEKTQSFCGNCSNCEAGFDTADVTVEAQKILSCIARTGQRYGINLIVHTLRGNQDRRLIGLGLDRQSTYGIMSDVPVKRIRRIMDTLILHQYVLLTNSEYPVLKLNAKANDILRHGAKLEMKVPRAIQKAKREKQEKEVHPVDPGLYEELKKLRFQLAAEAHVPAFVIFSDAALRDMCEKLPQTQEEFLAVSGVGQAKLKRYGDPFLKVIAPYAGSGEKPDDPAQPEKAVPAADHQQGPFPQETTETDRPWSAQEEEWLAREVENGLRITQIAGIHGRTVGSIQSRIRRLNLMGGNG